MSETISFGKKVGPLPPAAPAATESQTQPETAVAPPQAPAAPVAAPAPAPAVANPKTRKRRTVKEVDVQLQAQLDEIERLKAQLAGQQTPEQVDQTASEACGIPTAAEQKAQAPAPPAPEAPAPAPPAPPAPTPQPPAPAASTAAPEPAPAPPAPSQLPHERALATQAPAQLPARQDGGNALAAGSDAQITASDLKLSKVHIVQQIGELSREFRQGEVVYNREVTIYRPLKAGEQPQAINTPAQFITLGFKPKRWAERTQGGSGRIAYSEEEVIAMGGALTYGDHATNKKPWFQTLATMVGLLRKPEHLDDTRFPFEFNGTFWTFFEWGMKGSAYTDGAREIYSQRRIGSLRKSWMAHVWNLTTSLKDYPNGNSAYVPRLRPGALCGPEFQAWILDVLRGEEASELESMDESND